jgi:hypothetical protein
VTDLENLRPGEVKHQHAGKFCKSNSTRDTETSVVSQACHSFIWVAHNESTLEQMGTHNRYKSAMENVPED